MILRVTMGNPYTHNNAQRQVLGALNYLSPESFLGIIVQIREKKLI